MRGLRGRLFSLLIALVLVLGSVAGMKIPAQAAETPVVQIDRVTADGPGVQKFSVYVSGVQQAFYSIDGGQTTGLVVGTTTPVSVESSNPVMISVEYQMLDGSWGIATATSSTAYTAYVYAYAEGQVIWKDTVLLDMYNYPSVAYTAEASFEENGKIYTSSNNTPLLRYGDASARIDYTPTDMEARSYTVRYEDENDQLLYSYGGSLNYGESATIEAPATYEKDGRTYALETGYSAYNVTYDNVANVYTFEYAEVIPAPEEPYEITINLVDSDNNNALLYSIRQTVDVDSTVRVELPSTYEVNFKQYVLADGVENYIERAFADTRSTVYTIPYVTAGESAPYEITVNFVDYDNPETVLSAMTATITADGDPFIYNVGSANILDINGVEYKLLSGQGNDNGQIVHTYGTATRVYNVYYTAQEVDEPQPYTVTLRYISINDNSILETQQQEVVYGSSVSFDAAPEELDVGDTNYVRLNGQDEAITHEYNEGQTSYAVYYRDSSVEVEVEPEVITQVVTQYVTQDDGTLVQNQDGASVPVNVPVTTVTGGEGEEITYNEEGQQVAIEDGNITVLEDEEVPLADGTADTEEETVTLEDETVPLANLDVDGSGSASGNMPLIIGGIVIVAVIIIAGVYVGVIRRKKNAR